MDPLAEKYYSWSPYAYVMNNPLRNIDPFGMDVWSTNDPDQIAKLLAHLQSVAAGKTSDPFNYGGWSRMSDDEYKEANKDNSVSFNDDKLSMNINLDDYQANFNVGMRSKETKNAYISRSNIEDLLIDGDEDIDLSSSIAIFGAGASMDALSGAYLHKTSRLAKKIFPPSRIVGNAGKFTSIVSAGMRRVFPSWGGAASKVVGGVMNPVGKGMMLYGSWDIGRSLGYWYGGDSWVRSYRQSQYQKSKAPVIKPSGN